MKEKLVQELNELVQSGTKKTTIEEEVGLPANSLSSVLTGKKEMPDSWVPRLEEYLNKPTKLIVSAVGLQEKPSDQKISKVLTTMNKINKDLGVGTVMFFGEKTTKGYDVISTGSLGLDEALGVHGVPRGRIIELFGWESSGKTTIALNIISNGQKRGLRCLLVDAENAFDPQYAEALGVQLDKLQYCQPDYGEQALEVADRLISEGEVDIVVIDSVAALVPKAELEGEHGDSKMGLHARLMSQACRKMTTSVAKHNAILIFINQFRHKIGVMFGNPETTTGGNALKFYASIRMEVRRSTTTENSVMNGDVKEGNQTTVKVVKNKVSPPFLSATFNIMYGKGIDRLGEVIDMAIENGILTKAGSYYSYGQDKLGQGKAAVRGILEDNEELKVEIEQKVLEILNKK